MHNFAKRIPFKIKASKTPKNQHKTLINNNLTLD
jgi:hypothetical protein